MSDDPEKLVSGVVGPPVEFSTGGGFQVQALEFRPILDADRFPTWAHFDGALMQVHIGTKAASSIQGSAVMVAPGIAVGARHVVEGHLAEILAERCHVWVTAVGKSGRLDIWNVRHINMRPETDIAIFSLVRRSAMPPDDMLTIAVISTRTPVVGEAIMVAGFRDTAPDTLHAPDANRFGFSGEVRGSVGLVAEVYPVRRDLGMLNWPCFRITVGTFSGMSGGPAFDKNGHLVGVLCAGDGPGDGVDSPSYISMIYPALWERFLTAWPNGLYPTETSLLEIDRRMCAIVGGDRVYRGLGLDGEIQWMYDLWS